MIKKNYNDILDHPERAADILNNNGLVILPTDTQYGIISVYDSTKAVEQIYKLKKRTFDKPLIHLVSSMEMAEALVIIDTAAMKFLKKKWPGPVTFTMKLKKETGIMNISGFSTCAVRFPNEPLLIAIINQLGKAITAPSANIEMHKPIENYEEAIDQFGENGAELFIEKNNFVNSSPSELIDLTGDAPVILRERPNIFG